MKFKIKHERKGIQIISLVGFFMMFATAFIPDEIIRAYGVMISIFITLFFAALYFIEQAVGTKIIIEDGYILIKHIIWRKKIDISEIYDLYTERYQRTRKQGRYSRYTEWRLRLTICLTTGENIVLTDTATMVNGALGFLLSTHEPLQDDEVPLYKAYQIIESMKR